MLSAEFSDNKSDPRFYPNLVNNKIRFYLNNQFDDRSVGAALVPRDVTFR